MGTPVLVKEVPFVRGADENLEVLEQKIHEVEWKAVIEGTNLVIAQIQEQKKLAQAS